MSDIRFLQHSDIDKEKWDHCLKTSAHGNFYCLAKVLDTMSPNWNALIAGDYETVFPLTYRRRAGFNYLFQPPFLQQCGVFSLYDLDEDRIAQFLKAIPRKFLLIDIYLNEANCCAYKGFRTTLRKTQFLDLKEGYSRLTENYSENLKRNLAKAHKGGLQIQSATMNLVVDMFLMNSDKIGLTKDQKNDFKKLMNCYSTLDLVHFYQVVDNQNKTCASGAFANFGNRIVYLKGSCTVEGKQQGAMHFLLDYVIQKAVGLQIFDFGGSMVPGVERFYKSFGAGDREYPHVFKNNLPWFLKWFKS